MKKVVILLLACLLFVFAAPSYAQVLNPANGHYYELIQSTATWYTARDTAAGMSYNGLQGHLAAITSLDENAFVLNTWPDLGYPAEVWIGGSDEASEGNWQWITNEPWSYTYWNGGEPNNADGGENCLDYKYAGWNDSPCNAQFWYLVEYEPAALCTPPPSGMVSWWRAENNALDFVGANNGILMNGATFAAGMVNDAFSFDGVNDYISVPSSPGLDAGQLTVDAWVNPSSSQPGAPIINKRNIFNVGGYTLEFGYEGRINWYVYINGSWRVTTSSIALPLNTWTHVAGTYDGTTIRLYFNGSEVGSTAFSGSINSVVANLELGRNIPSPQVLFGGLIDEVEVFNRALSADEIAAIYNAGPAGKCVPVLTVNVDMPTGGTVKGGGINCPAGECSLEYFFGTKVILTATAKYSYKFRGWTGCDTPLKNKCTMVMTDDKNVTANFTGIYNISGKVVNHVGAPMTNVTVTLESVAGGGGGECGNQCVAAEAVAASEISRLVVTDAYGKYKFTQLPNGFYKVTPGKIGFTFNPLNQKVQILDGNASGVNFKLVY